MRIAASIAAVDTRLDLLCAAMLRAMCRCVTCATSCAITPASSLSFFVSSSSPLLTPMKPPGNAKALMPLSRMTKKLKRCEPSFAWLDRRAPIERMYSETSGSSRI